MTEEWLRRSRALPLSITFKSVECSHGEEADLPSLEPIFKLLRSHSVRWESINFDDVAPSIFHGLLSDLDTLQVETLHIDNGNHAGPSMEPVHMRGPFLPKTFHGINFATANISLQWDNLTLLHVSSIHVDDLVNIIRYGIEIEHCVAKVVRPSKGHYPLPSIPIANHSSIHLSTQSSSTPERSLLRYITLPSLRILEYSCEFWDEHIDILVDFIDRSRAPLHNFTFNYRIVRPFGADHWHDRLPGITHLRVKMFGDDDYDLPDSMDRFLEALAYDRDELALPNLQSLQLTTPCMEPSHWSLLVTAALPESEKTSIR